MAGRKVLVTGGCGNLGQHVVRACLAHGDEVRIFDRPDRKAEKVVADWPQVEVVWGDLATVDAAALVKDCDAVIHTAFMLYPNTERDPALADAVNVGGTRRLVQACAEQPSPPRFVFASSIAVFGKTQDQDAPRRATDPVAPCDMYSSTKVDAEKVVTASPIPWSILRIGMAPPVNPTSGPVAPSREFFELLFAVRADNRVEFVHPADAGRALAAASWEPAAERRILLIGGGERCRIRSLDVTNGIFESVGVGTLPADVFGNDQLYADWLDSDEAEEILHFRQHTFEQFLTEMRANIGWRRSLIRPFGPLLRWFLVNRFAPRSS